MAWSVEYIGNGASGKICQICEMRRGLSYRGCHRGIRGLGPMAPGSQNAVNLERLGKENWGEPEWTCFEETSTIEESGVFMPL